MAEIKSTLELALERTRKISISEEEKEEIKKKGILQKVSGWFNRYLEEDLSIGDMVREMERMEGKTRALIRETLLSQLIGAISLDDENEKLVKAIESLKGRGADKVKEKLAFLLSEYERTKEAAEKEMLTRRKEALRQEGISGSAVVPNVQGTNEWREKMGGLHQAFRGRIDEIREAFRKL